MKNKELVHKIQPHVSLKVEQTTELLKLTTSVISKILADGDSLTIQGFGTFQVKKKEERITVNPVTSNRWMIPPKLVPCFKPGTTLKEKLKSYDGHEQ